MIAPSAINHIAVRCWLSLMLGLAYACSYGQVMSEHPVILLGNVVDIHDRSPALRQVISHLNTLDEFTVVLTGDFGDHDLQELRILLNYMNGRPDSRMLILQGDRDWDDSGVNGWQESQRLEELVNYYGSANVIWVNQNGCPGPSVVTLSPYLQFIGINTQWFNHPYPKPSDRTEYCEYADTDDVLQEVSQLLDDFEGQNVLIGGHFPIVSNGPYGGRYPFKDWIGPIPFISGFITSYKKNIGGRKEINNVRYERFRDKFRNLVFDRPSIIYASGHDYHHEVLELGDSYLINSGGIGRQASVKHSLETVQKNEEAGFTELIYGDDGKVSCVFHQIKEETDELVFKPLTLFQPSCELPIEDIPVNSRLVPCAHELLVLDQMLFEYPDQINRAPSLKYSAGPIKSLFMGQHYRSAWSTEVDMDVLHLDRDYGGLWPYSSARLGNIKTLYLRDSLSNEYKFRLVDQDLTKRVEHDFTNEIIDILLQDQTTVRVPYAPLTVPTWMEELNLLHAHPKMYVMPDDPKLGPWRVGYGDQVGFLTEDPRQSVHADDRIDDIVDTRTLYRQRFEDLSSSVEYREYLTMRLLDMYLGNWGRDESSVGWAVSRLGLSAQYRPISLEHDMVFSKFDGLLPWLADREWAKVSIEHFGRKFSDLKSLNWSSLHMDRLLLSELDKKDWMYAAQLVYDISDSLTNIRALSNIPDELQYEIDEIQDKLTSRHEHLVDGAMKYYAMLSKEVDVIGSAGRDHFIADIQKDGSVDVSVMKAFDEQSPLDYLQYHRVFRPDETKEIRLYGLKGDDQFMIQGESHQSIKLRVVPGLGDDVIIDRSNVQKKTDRATVYVAEGETDSISLVYQSSLVRSSDAVKTEYRYGDYRHNGYLPLFYVFYNADRGVDVGARVTFSNYRFGYTNKSSEHRVAIRASNNGNLELAYYPTWYQRLKNYDIIGRVEIERSRLFNYYFGEGAFEPYEQELLNNNYYSLEYSTMGAGLGLSRKFWKNASISALFNVNYNSDQQRQQVIADTLNIRGLRSNVITRMDIVADLDLLDRSELPRYGFRFYSRTLLGTDVMRDDGSFVTGSSFIEIFNTFKPITVGVRLGGLMNFGDVPYFLNHYLGQDSYLKGFRQNRFLGDRALFVNSEFRVELINKPIAAIPHQFGLNLFADMGKLYVDTASDQKLVSDWKIGYGGGIYFVPYKEKLTLHLSVGFSDEESALIQFRIGRRF